jgi:hypothetical protein
MDMRVWEAGESERRLVMRWTGIEGLRTDIILPERVQTSGWSPIARKSTEPSFGGQMLWGRRRGRGTLVASQPTE